jgi:hypothetical protein
MILALLPAAALNSLTLVTTAKSAAWRVPKPPMRQELIS